MEFFAQEKLDEAVEAYKRALAEDPKYADALHALAMTYAHQDKLDDAIEVGKRLIDAAPEDELAYTSLSPSAGTANSANRNKKNPSSRSPVQRGRTTGTILRLARLHLLLIPSAVAGAYLVFEPLSKPRLPDAGPQNAEERYCRKSVIP